MAMTRKEIKNKYRNSVKGKETERLYREKNREKSNERSTKWQNDNRDRHNDYMRKYREKYPEKSKIQYLRHKDTRKRESREVINARLRPYARNRRATDLNYKITGNLRTRLYQALKGNFKTGSAIKDLDCSIDELKQKFISLFTEGMNWDNYGLWEIDHIRPCASFDLTDPAQVKECCHYSNLQPLWAADNLAKSDKILTSVQ